MVWNGMNPPEPAPWTPDDVIRECKETGSERKAAKIYCIPLAEVRKLKKLQEERKCDCTTCLWEYMCDWDEKECRYVPERGANEDDK